MAAAAAEEEEEAKQFQQLLKSYIGMSFSLFLASLPKNASQAKEELKARLRAAEEQLKQMKSRRKEDSKANARVVEIFASHRNAWQAEEKRLLQQIDGATEEMASLRSKIEELERDKLESDKRVQELEDMIGFMSRSGCEFEVEQQQQQHYHQHQQEEDEEFGVCESRECYGGADDGQNGNFSFSSEFLASASKFWTERASSLWQV